MSELPDLWVDPKEIAAARAEGQVWAVQAHNYGVVNQDARYVPADRIKSLREALRKHGIYACFDDDRGPMLVCRCCGGEWTPGEPEQHFPGCLAALAQQEGGG